MTGIAEIIFQGGVPQQLDPNAEKPASPRRRGLKQGAGMFLLGVLIVPIMAIFHELFRFPEQIVALFAVIFFLGGILRMIYALFESSNPAAKTLEENVYQTAQTLLKKNPQPNALPLSQSVPASVYVPPTQGNWRDTNDLTPTSVTEKTTKLLKDE